MQTASYKNSHGNVKYSVGNRVNNTVITVWCQMGARLTGGSLHKAYKCLITRLYSNTGWGKSRFIVMNMQNTEFILVLLIIVLFSILTTVNLLLPHLV